jgi:uncharacterized protein (DUF1684 family)
MKKGYLIVTVAFAVLCSVLSPVLADDAGMYDKVIEKHRKKRIDRMTATDGWLSVSGLYWLFEGDNYFGPGFENSIVIDAKGAPEVAGKFNYQNGEVFLFPIQDAGVTLNDAPAQVTQLSDGANSAVVGLGRFKLRLIQRSGRHAIRARDPQNPAIAAFSGIDFFPIDASYNIVGKLEPYDEIRSYFVDTVIGTTAELVSRGKVRFTLQGEEHELEALATSEQAKELFLMFKDGTTGDESYPAGRYLYAPFEAGRVDLDFNKAYNPPCAFTSYATCPLPPQQNNLSIFVRAGERKYHPN